METSLIEKRILVAGARGMVGSAIVRRLQAAGCRTVHAPSRQELDLTQDGHVRDWFARHRPEVVVVAAAKVGGIVANNTLPADFLAENLAIALNTIGAARAQRTPRLLFLGISCIYPREATQPIREDALLTGPLEPTNEAYAVAKIAGMKFCQACRRQDGLAYHSLMPTNLYGPGDNYHPLHSHVLPALLRRFHEAARDRAASVTCWGSGSPRREFLHVDDLAEAVWHVLNLEDPLDWYNVGPGEDLPIRELASLAARVTGFTGEIRWDTSKPDGTPRKLLDSSALRATGWAPRIPLAQGLASTYADFMQRLADGTLRS